MRDSLVLRSVRGPARAPAAAALLVILAVPAAGQEPGSLVTDRPDQTESAAAVPGGFVQLEAGWTFARESNEAGEVESHSLPGALLRVGLGNGLEARLGIAGYVFEQRFAPGSQVADASGFGDAEVGLKLELASGPAAEVALLGSASLPIGEEDFSSERVDPSLRLLVAHPLGDRLSIGYNLGLAWATESVAGGLDTQVEAPYTLALGIGLTDRVGAFVEGFGAFGLSDDRDAVHSLDGGFTVLLSDRLQLDLSAGLGLNEAAEDWFLGSGLSLRLPR